MHQEKVQQEKIKAVKARLKFEEVSQHSELGTPSRRKDLSKRLESKHICSIFGSLRPRRGRSESPRKRDPERKTMFKRLDLDVSTALGDKGKNVSTHSNSSRRQSYHSGRRGTNHASEKHHNKITSSYMTEDISESEGSAGGHWKSRSKKQRSSIEDDDLSQPWVCKETNPFTPRIPYFDLPKRTRMPSHVKTYDGSEDPEDHLKIFQAAGKVKRWETPTWCHMFNFTLTGSARKKCIKDPVEIHHIKQKEGESTEDFVRKFKVESRDVKGAPEIMRISGFMHGITNPELIKRLHDKIPKSVDETMRITTSFLRGEVAAGNQEWKKLFSPWKQQEAGHKQNFKKGGFKNQQRSERRQDRFTLLSKSPKEIMALEKGKFKAPPPMTTLIEKRNSYKFNGKLSHVIKELKQNNGKDQPKTNKKGETSSKDKALEILMTPPGNKKSDGSGPAPLIGFNGEIIWPLGQLSLLVKIGDEEHSTSAWMNFVVVRSSSSYNRIIERPGVRKIKAVPSTAHGMLKLRSSKIIPIECASVLGPERQPPAAHQAIEERIKVAINLDYPEQTIMIGSTLTEEGRTSYVTYSNGYHQIKMAKEDEEKTTFITSQGVFCYSKMPFGLRNVGATYQRLVDKAFHKQICKNIEVYVDDIVIKSCTKDEVIRDIEETFKTLREINMKLNLKKCTSGVEEGMFLGYKVNTKGIKVCPDKVDAVLSLPSPKCLKDVQKLNGKLAILNRFLAKSAEKSLPFFKTLKKCTKKSDFHWTEEADAAFKQMKQLIAELPTLTAQEEKEELIVYLAAAKEAVIVEEEGNTWMTLIYEYLTEETLPAEVNKARAGRRKSQWFAVINGVLYKKSFLRPWLRHTTGYAKALVNRILLAYYAQGCKGIDKGMPRLSGSQTYPKKSAAKADPNHIPMAILQVGNRHSRTFPGRSCFGINLDLLEERREQAAIREAKSKAKMEKYYNSKVRSTSFKPGDLVYRNNDASCAKEVGKLGPKWEGPYEVTEALGRGAYKLRDRDGKKLPRT
ncbi:reverse transcriptase domain-containing protein [Tanacetum coccineum]